MLDHWLAPIDLPDILGPAPLPPNSTWHHIQYYGKAFPDLTRARIAVVGIDATAANAIRRAWYPLIYQKGQVPVADVGNVRNTSLAFLIPLMKELLASGVIPVLIGAQSTYQSAQYAAFLEVLSEISLVVIDEQIALSPPPPSESFPHAYLDDILRHPHHPPFHLGVIGHQIHQIHEAAQDALIHHNADAVRLGKARAQMEEVEPIIRDADLVGFHLPALRGADCPAVDNPSPSGFTCEEACQISRYAGMSDKLKTFGIFGYQPKGDAPHHLSAQVAAQMIWYFIDGVSQRKQDFPVSTDSLTEYVVDLKDFSYPLTFWKSKRSGRWWMQIPVKTRQKYDRHRLVPCSYEDYRKATRDELPDRLLLALRRFP